MRNELNPAVTNIADRLLAVENESHDIAAEDALATCRVCEKLRRTVSGLVGSAAFTAVFQRALDLARRDSPALGGVEVLADGYLVGFQGAAVASSSVLVAHLLQLLFALIGDGLTMTLINEIWPKLDGLNEPMSKPAYER